MENAKYSNTPMPQPSKPTDMCLDSLNRSIHDCWLQAHDTKEAILTIVAKNVGPGADSLNKCTEATKNVAMPAVFESHDKLEEIRRIFNDILYHVRRLDQG